METPSTPDSNREERINKLKRAFAYNLFYKQGMTARNASLNDLYLSVAQTLRDRMQHLFVNSVEALTERESKIVCYLSAEFLEGPHRTTIWSILVSMMIFFRQQKKRV